jgi:hypothetical protein
MVWFALEVHSSVPNGNMEEAIFNNWWYSMMQPVDPSLLPGLGKWIFCTNYFFHLSLFLITQAQVSLLVAQFVHYPCLEYS